VAGDAVVSQQLLLRSETPNSQLTDASSNSQTLGRNVGSWKLAQREGVGS
jgi:hypothetical protein